MVWLRWWAAPALLLALACSQPAGAAASARHLHQDPGAPQLPAAEVAADEPAAVPAQEPTSRPVQRQPPIVPLPSALGQLPSARAASGSAAAPSSETTATSGAAAGDAIQPRTSGAPAPEATNISAALAAPPAAEVAAPSAAQAAGAPAQKPATAVAPPRQGTARPGYWTPVSSEQLQRFACGLGGISTHFQV